MSEMELAATPLCVGENGENAGLHASSDKTPCGRDLTGQRFGRWTVLGATTRSASGEVKWLCRCDCGTERYVLDRSLRCGASKSCGCASRENAHRANAHDLLGQTFGDLTVVGKSKRRASNRFLWSCLCSCGYTCEATSTQLLSGQKTHCGCKTRKNYAFADITGQRFNRLTALFRVKTGVGRGGSVLWHCRCDCGRELDVSYNELVYSNLQSCGCKKLEHNEKLPTLQTHVDGTSIEILQGTKIPSNNTSGYRGVYFVKGKYLAKIVFQRKQYFLGTYDNIEDAASARKDAEKLLFEDTVAFYRKWKARADADPQWGQQNPVAVRPFKGVDGRLCVSYSPEL